MADLHTLRPNQASIIKTQRLTLHAFEDADLEDALELLCNSEIKKTYIRIINFLFSSVDLDYCI